MHFALDYVVKSNHVTCPMKASPLSRVIRVLSSYRNNIILERFAGKYIDTANDNVNKGVYIKCVLQSLIID